MTRNRSNESLFDRGYGSDEQPDFEVRDDSGDIIGVGWNKTESSQRPEHYDESYPNKNKPGYRIYLLFFALAILVFLCIFPGYIIRFFIDLVA